MAPTEGRVAKPEQQLSVAAVPPIRTQVDKTNWNFIYLLDKVLTDANHHLKLHYISTCNYFKSNCDRQKWRHWQNSYNQPKYFILTCATCSLVARADKKNFSIVNCSINIWRRMTLGSSTDRKYNNTHHNYWHNKTNKTTTPCTTPTLLNLCTNLHILCIIESTGTVLD